MEDYFYEVGVDEYTRLLKHKINLGKGLFDELCGKYFNEFPKKEEYDKGTDKTYYSFSDEACVDYIVRELVRNHNFTEVVVDYKYCNYRVL